METVIIVTFPSSTIPIAISIWKKLCISKLHIMITYSTYCQSFPQNSQSVFYHDTAWVTQAINVLSHGIFANTAKTESLLYRCSLSHIFALETLLISVACYLLVLILPKCLRTWGHIKHSALWLFFGRVRSCLCVLTSYLHREFMMLWKLLISVLF